MAEQLNIQLTDSFFLLDPGEPATGGFKIQVRNDSGQNISCKRIRVKIPYGEAAPALTNSNDFGVANIEWWSEDSAPFTVEDGYVIVDFENDGEVLEDGISDTFNFFELPFLPNPEGMPEREADILVECYAAEGDAEPSQTMLALTLKNQPEDVAERQPFVNYFALASLEPSEITESGYDPKRVFRLKWDISHGKEMMVVPNWLSNRDQPLAKARSVVARSDQDEQPILIDTEEPIELTRPSGDILVELRQSTQFTLTPDMGGADQKWSQLVIYLKELTIIDFSAQDYDHAEPYPYLKPLLLDCVFTFTDPKALDNRAFILVKEYNNEGQLLKYNPPPGLDEKIKELIKFENYTRVIPLNARQNKNTVTYYPVRNTEFELKLYQNHITNPKLDTSFSIMTNPDPHPIGSITMFSGTVIPKGWRLCAAPKNYIDRSEIPNTFDELAQALGYDEPPGTRDKVWFPDLRDRFPVGAGSNNVLNKPGNPDRHTHEVNLPSRSTAPTTEHYGKRGFKISYAVGSSTIEVPHGYHRHKFGFSITSKSSSAKDLNRPHFYPLNFIIRVE